jgi:hypothetical protein
MSALRTSSRAEQLAPWIAGALVALPILVARYPPMADLPLHEAIVGLLRHWGDPSFVPPDVYEFHPGHPNQLFYFLALALSYVVRTDTAMKLVAAAAVCLMPVAAARLADHLGVTRWTSLLVAPVALGWMFFWGLLALMIGLDLYLFALPTIDRFCEKPTRRTLAVACGWIVLLHFAHDAMSLTAGATIVLFTMTSWKGWRANAMRLGVAALAMAVFEGSRLQEMRVWTSYQKDALPYVFTPLAHKVLTAPGALFGGYDTSIRNAIFGLSALPMVLFAIERWKNRSALPASWRERAHHFRFELLAAALLLLYLVAPQQMKWTTLIYHRFLPPAWILLALTVATRRKLDPPWRLPRLIVAVVPLAPVLVAWPHFVDSDHQYRDLDDVMAHIAKDSTLVVLELGPTNVYELYQPASCGGHVVATLGGRELFDFTQSPVSPVVLRPEKQWVEVFRRVDQHAYDLVPDHDLQMFRYVLLHTTDFNIAEIGRLALEPEARLVFAKGDWTLLESTLPLVPIDSVEQPLKRPHGPTLRKRALAVMEHYDPAHAIAPPADPGEATHERAP